MIIISLIGGLGNQLFQYAAARALSAKHTTFLKIDSSQLTAENQRHFDLLNFAIKINLATPAETERYQPKNYFDKLSNYLSSYKKKKYYKEKYFHFNNSVLNLPDNVYLKGYFQSEKYFLSIKKELRGELQFNDAVIDAVKNLSNLIQKTNAVSVHIRRGDYLKQSETQRYHGILDISYYQQAIELIQSKTEHPHFYFFSDDINWAKENFSLSNSTFVSGELSQNHLQDLYLMSNCRHHIIANSSFSWWGAWLNDKEDKMVIAPKQWFLKGPKDIQDLIPENWITI